MYAAVKFVRIRVTAQTYCEGMALNERELVLGIIVFSSGRKPFKDMELSEIASATVWLSPPDKTILITDIEELINYLNDVVVYNKDNSYTESCGQGVIFTLTMADGTQTEIMAYNPFLVIDGVGYKTKYESCQARNGYANRLLNERDTMIILEKPPALDVIINNTCNSTLLGIYSWQCKNNDGTFTNMEAVAHIYFHCSYKFLYITFSYKMLSESILYHFSFFCNTNQKIVNY